MNPVMWYISRLLCHLRGHKEFDFSPTIKVCRRCWQVRDVTTGEVTLAY